VAKAGVEVARDVGGWRSPADSAAAHLGADEWLIPPVVLRDHGPGEVERSARDMRVDVYSAREHDHPCRVDRPATLDLGDDPAITATDVPALAVDAVGRVVNLPALDPQHGVPDQLALSSLLAGRSRIRQNAGGVYPHSGECGYGNGRLTAEMV